MSDTLTMTVDSGDIVIKLRNFARILRQNMSRKSANLRMMDFTMGLLFTG
jgi:hypothetical protein